MSKRVLIISFSMPPSPDIGARRWVKFAKYLKKKGHLVKIIAAHEHFPEISQWQKDLAGLEGDLAFTASGYPRYLGIRPQSLLDKVLYRASLHYAKLRSKGNYYDKSNLWAPALLKASRNAIKSHGINNVICTIPPFKMAYHLLALKKEFPGVNFIVDYRDPWTNNKTAFGFMHLSAARFRAEARAEERVVKEYDRILAVSEEMKEHFKTLLDARELDKKFVAIPNGFDREDFLQVSKPVLETEKRNTLKIVFAGTFYDKSFHVLEKLAETVSALEEAHPARKGLLQFIFIGSMPQNAELLVKANSTSFSFLGRKNLSETYSLLGDADFCALFLTDDLNYSLSTKFYEYLALKKPIISFSKHKGANARFIEENGIGIGVSFSTMKEEIEKLMNKQPLVAFNPKLDASVFDIKNLAEQLEHVLI